MLKTCGGFSNSSVTTVYRAVCPRFQAVANESGLNFISVKGPELLNMVSQLYRFLECLDMTLPCDTLPSNINSVLVDLLKLYL
jgi:hypothetical protein